MAAFLILMAIGFALLSATWAVIVIREWTEQPMIVVVGHVGLAVAAAGITAMFSSIAAVPYRSAHLGTRRVVVQTSDPTRGTGVELLQSTMFTPLTLIFIGFFLYGQCAWWAWRGGTSESLLPMSRDNSVGATLALLISLALLACLVLMILAKRWRVAYQLYPSGVLRQTTLPGSTKSRFIPWESISGIRGDERYISPYLRSASLIVAELLDSAPNTDHALFDRPGEFGIPAYLLECDSNLLLAVMSELAKNPSSRELLMHPRAADWFTHNYHGEA